MAVCATAEEAAGGEAAEAAGEAEAAEDAGNDKDALPPVEAVISPALEGLPAPQPPQAGRDVAMAVTAIDKETQDHVRHGITCLHGAWDFEAYRHFCAALERDPRCLMAHWGAALALLQCDPGQEDEREAALERLLALVDEGAGTELERGYAYGLISFLREGPAAAANAFRKVADDFPNDPRLVLLASLFGRTGYDEFGDATVDQERAEDDLRALVREHPGVPIFRYVLLAVRAEAPDLAGDLPLARDLCREVPDYPPFQHLLGHYEWRSGNHGRAARAFARASELYAGWMERNELDALSCPGWTKSESYRAVALASAGDHEAAFAVARAVAAVPVPESRKLEAGREDPSTSRGARMLLWEGRTLPTRLALHRDGAGDVALAIKLLPPKDPLLHFGKASLAPRAYQGYAFYLEGRKAIEAGKLEEARQIADAATLNGAEFTKLREAAMGLAERSEWLRNFNGMEIMVAELRGLLAMAGEEGRQVAAVNWFRSANDRQKPASLMMPPLVLLPMEARLAEYQLEQGETGEAVRILEEAEKEWPNQWAILIRLEKAYRRAGEGDKAEATALRIKAIREG